MKISLVLSLAILSISCVSRSVDPCILQGEDSLYNDTIEVLILNDELAQASNSLSSKLAKDSSKAIFFNNMGAIKFKQYESLDYPDSIVQNEVLYNLHKANELCPNSKSTIGNLVESYYSFNNFEGVIKYGEIYLEIFPQNTRILSRLSYCHQELEEYKTALQYSNMAVKLDSSCAKCYADIGISLSKLNRHKEAIKNLKKSIQIDPTSRLSHYSLANSYYLNEEKSKALELYHTAYELDSLDQINLIALGNMYKEQNDFVKACKYYKKSIEKPCIKCNPRVIQYIKDKSKTISDLCK